MRLFEREQSSLFGDILDWMLTPLLLIWPISLALTWAVAQELANNPFDRALEDNVLALSRLVQVQQRQVQLALPAPAREILRADEADLVFYQALGARGEFLSGERDLPIPPEDEKPVIGAVRLRDDVMRGQELRIAYTWVKIDLPGAQPVLVQVAETREKRSVLATEIVKGMMLPQFAILPLAVLLVWLALVRGIRPLNDLEARIRARRPDDLSPLDEHLVPIEVAPLVASVNELLARLKDSITLQKRFLADAAHQLKTPLAGLRMQAELAQRKSADAVELRLSLHQIGLASQRATHAVNQLLSLARAEAGNVSAARAPTNLAKLAQEVITESLARALEKRIDLGYEGPEPGAPGVEIQANPLLITEMLRNLVDNAISFTPSNEQQPGVITVRLIAQTPERGAELQVEDSGPGVAPAEREQVFQPFHRTLGTATEGTGLGLAIVREIAAQHGATVSVEDVDPVRAMPGARFVLRFPGPQAIGNTSPNTAAQA
jgi:two-component system, OmpR family, sensor histidine kinase TctE